MKNLTLKTFLPFSYDENGSLVSKRYGTASLSCYTQPAGIYSMEFINGYTTYSHDKDILCWQLQINGSTVMVDDPLHHIGMRELAKRSSGHVLVAGLGMGIVVRFLLDNPEVKSITVYEINQDVIDLISPLMKDSKLRIIKGDFIEEQPFRDPKYNTVIIDLWVSGEGIKPYVAGFPSFELPMTVYPLLVQGNTCAENVFVWGLQDSFFNPSIPEVDS